MYTCTVKLSTVARPVTTVPAFTTIPIHWFPPLLSFISTPGDPWVGIDEAALSACIAPVIREKSITEELDPRAQVLSVNIFEHPKLMLDGSYACLRITRDFVSRLQNLTQRRVYGFRPYTKNDVSLGRWLHGEAVFDGFAVDAYPSLRVVDEPAPTAEAEYSWYARNIQNGIGACIGTDKPIAVFGTAQYFQTRHFDDKGVPIYDGDPIPQKVIRTARAMAEPVGDFVLYGEFATQQGADQYAAALSAI